MLPSIVATLLCLATAASAASTAPLDPKTGLPQRPIAGVLPGLDVAIVALVLFGALAAAHWIHYARMGRKFMLVLCIGTTAMALGFAMRIVLHYNAYSMGLYIIEDLLILLSPCAFLAADYVILTQISTNLGQKVADDCLVLPTTRIVKLFVISDISTFLIQAAGGGMSAIPSIATVGQKIALVGLILQLVSFSSFTAVLLTFGYRVRSRYPEQWSRKSYPARPEPSLLKFWSTTPIGDWKVLYYAVCYTCIGILIRSSFRIVEFSQGYSGYIPTHEIYFYLLDSLPLLLAMSVYIFVWPSRCISVVDGAEATVTETPSDTSKEEVCASRSLKA